MSSTNAQLGSASVFDELLLDCFSSPLPYIPDQISADIRNPNSNPDLEDDLGIGNDIMNSCTDLQDDLGIRNDIRDSSPFQPEGEVVERDHIGSEVNTCNVDQSNSNAKSRGVKKRKTLSTGCSPGENHKLLERERRKYMHNLLMTLHSLLPDQLLLKKEQSAILDETIKYIPLAEAQLDELKTKKKSLLGEGEGEGEGEADRVDNISTGIQSSSSQIGGHVKTVLESRGANNNNKSNGSSSSGDDCCANNISVKFEANGEVNIILPYSNKSAVPFSRIMEELEMEGLVVTNCSLFNNGTTFFSISVQ
ncbi:hypothetical protein KI387_019378, partial [Taxus chinensis]